MKASPADPDILCGLIPFDGCTEDELIVLSEHAWVIDEAQGHVLAELGTSNEWDYYLLVGELLLESGDGKTLTIRAGSEAARHPVAHLQPRRYTIRARTPVRYLRVQTALLTSLKYGPNRQPSMLVSEVEGDGVEEHPLYTVIQDDLVNDRLVLPSLPELAVRIRQLVDREDVTMQQVARLVQTDPAISAKLMKIANGALYHGMRQVESCLQAISRLGLVTTRNLVVSFVLRNLFREKIHDARLMRHVTRLWEHSVEVGVIAQVLADVTPGMNPDEALLVGLLHDIGELVILSYAESSRQVRDDETALEAVIADLKGELGALILREWKFSEAFVTAAREAEEWRRDPAPEPDYCDIAVVAQLHGFLGTPRSKDLPPLTEVPAFRKIARGKLTPELSMRLLDQAKGQVAEVKQLLLG